MILYEMFCGRRPFERETAVETLSATIREQPTAIQTVNAGVTFPIQQIVERCLAKNPAIDTRIRGSLRSNCARFAIGGTARPSQARRRCSRQHSQRRGPFLMLRRPPSASRGVVRSGSPAERSRPWRQVWAPGDCWPQDTGIRVLAVLPFSQRGKRRRRRLPVRRHY